MKQKKVVAQPINRSELSFDSSEMPFCCGIEVIGDFLLEQQGNVNVSRVSVGNVQKLRREFIPGNLTLATTVIAEPDGDITNSESQLAADTTLESLGFERLMQFKGNGGRLLQLWGYNRAPPSAAFIKKVEASWKKFNPVFAEEGYR